MFIMPMAGNSSRFYKAGYSVPKYELMLREKSIFEHSLLSFKRYFGSDKFLFIAKKSNNSSLFIEEKVQKLGVKWFDIIELENPTLGQADTVLQGLKNYTNQPIFIFNIDTFLLNYIKPSWLNQCDGYMEVFEGEGSHWSFAKPGEDYSVIKTSEKQRISSLCSDGMYYFKSSDLFKSIVKRSIKSNSFVKGEIYIAPIYNNLISQNRVVKYDLIDIDFIKFCGTPEEYNYLLNSY